MDLLPDLLAHNEWADAEQWRVLAAHATALQDDTILKRLHHIHLVQHAFLSVVLERVFEPTKPEEFATPLALRDYGRGSSTELASVLERLDPARLEAPVMIPWFKDPSFRITHGEALVQAAMHGHWHRGQNVTRLRELGGQPPTTDLILWYWKGRPAAVWE